MESLAGWCFIEGDVGLLTLLIKNLGATANVEQIFGMSSNVYDNIIPVHGLILMFNRIVLQHPSSKPVITDPHVLSKIYFASQIINNACVTQAILSILLNCAHPDVDIGSDLASLKYISMPCDPLTRGVIMSSSLQLRCSHNFMAQRPFFMTPPKSVPEGDEPGHFVSFIPIEGRLYEMDGLLRGPIDHGPIMPGQNWLHIVNPIIVKRIKKCKHRGIKFNLVAVVSDRKMIFQRRIEHLLYDMEIFGANEVSQYEINLLRRMIELEDEKMKKYKLEQIRRRHNYLPFIVTLLKILAEEKMLTPLLERAKERAVEDDVDESNT